MYVLLLDKVARSTFNPLGSSPDPATVLDDLLMAEPLPAKPIDREMAELMDALGVSR